LGGPSNSARDQAATPPLPPPASPPQPATTALKPTESQPSKPTEDLAAALERPGDLNLHGVSLDKALFMIGDQWNINIVAGEVKGTVNGTFKQAPLREILDAILLSNGYNYRAVGKSLVISSIEQLGQINPYFQSAIIPVQTADIDEVVQGAQLLKTPKGEVRAIKSAHSIVVLDFPDRVKMIRDFVSTLDTAGSGRFGSAESRNGMPLEVGYFRTQHISAKTAEQALQAVLSKAGRATVLEKEDRLLVTDYPDNLEMVEKVMRSIDRPRPQVRITALLYDISLQDIEQLGINWNQQIHGHPDSTGKPQGVIGIDSITAVPFQTGTAGSTLTFMNLSKHFDITAVVQALQSAKDARLLADPNVAVLENEEAQFEKVEEIPYQQLTQTQQGGSIGTTAFKKAGIELTVTPKIAAEGIIRMAVNPKVSRLVGFTPGDNQPIIDTSSASTVLTVANKQTVAIGGLRQRNDAGEFNGVPYLKDLNVIGRLFRSRDLDVREGELVVFISPEIISYSDEPTCRQKLTEDTIRCRLDQVPQAEGCPPCCRRLPCGPDGAILPDADQPADPAAPVPTPTPAADQQEQLPQPTVQPQTNDSAFRTNPYSPEPLVGGRLSSSQSQIAATGHDEPMFNSATNGVLRRLPTVVPIETRVAVAPTRGRGLFPAPPALTGGEDARAAEREAATSIWR
jgi:general secretion pathway protein D